jgi:maltooligosyltrehalose trehalohydrolase
MPREAGGYGMDAQWSDDFHHALFTVLHGGEGEKGYYADFGSLAKLGKALTKTFVLDGTYSKYRGRSHGRSAADISPHRFLGYIQNHDQVGNRAIGDRIEQIAGMDLGKVAAGLVMTAPFIPMIFQGEEYAASTHFQYFADHEDPEMARAVKEGRQSEFAAFGWAPEDVPDPEKRETFLQSKLNWDEVHRGKHEEMLEWYRRLIALRRGSASLNDGTLGQTEVVFDEERRWLMMSRGAVVVMCNLGVTLVELKRPRPFPLLLGSRPEVGVVGDQVVLPPNTLAILSGEKNQRPV